MSREALINSEGWDWPAKKVACKARNRSNSWLLQDFATPQEAYFCGQVRPYE